MATMVNERACPAGNWILVIFNTWNLNFHKSHVCPAGLPKCQMPQYTVVSRLSFNHPGRLCWQRWARGGKLDRYLADASSSAALAPRAQAASMSWPLPTKLLISWSWPHQAIFLRRLKVPTETCTCRTQLWWYSQTCAADGYSGLLVSQRSLWTLAPTSALHDPQDSLPACTQVTCFEF